MNKMNEAKRCSDGKESKKKKKKSVLNNVAVKHRDWFQNYLDTIIIAAGPAKNSGVSTYLFYLSSI